MKMREYWNNPLISSNHHKRKQAVKLHSSTACLNFYVLNKIFYCFFGSWVPKSAIRVPRMIILPLGKSLRKAHRIWKFVSQKFLIFKGSIAFWQGKDKEKRPWSNNQGLGARDGTWTRTGLPHAPQTCASADSATLASACIIYHHIFDLSTHFLKIFKKVFRLLLCFLIL